MDYDDNDFQSQNLQLAGEGSSTFPPVLRQYALPKYDFDDNIQGHVRFDSLVETEVFLGIESNEDSQWIEAFTRGSSGVEFSTSAAENCCILRRKNVWSEATSSESVEMLLKSVGQEDINPLQARIEESNDCDKAKQMEPTIKHDNKSFPEMENIMNLESTTIPAESHEEFLGVMEPTIRQCESHFSEMESVMNLERTSLPDEIHEEFSDLKEDTKGEMNMSVDALENLDESLIHIDSNMSWKDSGLPKVEGCQINDWNSNLMVQKKVDSLVKISLQENEWENSCASGNPIDGIASSTQNLTAHGFELNEEQLNRQITMESSYGSQTGSAKQKEEENGSKKKVQSDDQDTVISASLEIIVQEKVDTGITKDEDDSNVISKVSYESNVGKEHNEIVHSEISAESGRFDDKVMWKSGEWGDQSEVSVVPVLSKGETTFDSHIVEAQGSHIGTGMCASQESKTDSVVSVMCTNTVVEDRDGLQLTSDMLVIKASSSLSTRQNKEVSKGEECSSSPVGESYGLPPICSAGLSEDKATLRGEHNASGVVIENLNAEVVKAVMLADSAQICEDTIHHGKDNVCGLDVSAGEKDTTRSSYESISSDYQVDEGVHSSAFGEHRTDNNLVVHSVQCNETNRKDPAPIYLDSVAISGSLYNAHLGIGDGVIVDKHINHNKDQVFNSEVDHGHLDAKEESKVSAKESISTLLGSSQLEATSCPISYAADDTSIIIGEKTSSDKTNHSVPQKEKCDMEVESESEAAASNEVSKNGTKEMDAVPVSCELMAKIGDSVDVLPVMKQVSPNDQMLRQSMASSLQEIQESNGKSSKDQELNQTVSASEGKNDGQAVNSDCGTDKEFSSSAAFGQSNVQESAGCTISGKPASPSGAEILYGFEYENKFSKGPLMPILLVSESSDVNAMNKWSTSQNPTKSTASENARSVPLEPTPLEDLSNTESSMDQQSFPAISAAKISPIVEGSLSTPAFGLTDPQDATHGSPQASDREVMHGHRKGSTERRTRRSSAKGTKKESTKKVNLPKTVKSLKQSGGDKSSNLPSSPGVFHPVHSDEAEHHRHVESSNVKPFVFVTASTSNLPDLNSSASPSAMFQQPFTDLQQVELRAQIFVYGALIQGIAPDEAYMLAAFGGPDSGRSLWENAWRMCTERLHGQKSYPTSSETSLQSHLGAKGVDQAIKQSTPQSKVFSSPVSRVSNKSTAAVVNSMIPPTSPLWNIANPSEALHSVVPRGSIMEYQQSLSPLYPYQTPPMRNFIGATTPWLSQAPFRSPWVATPQTSAPEVARLSALPITEPVHLTPLKEPFIPHSSGLKLPGPMVHSSISTTVFPVLSPLLDTKRTSVQQSSIDPKPRKRKKITVLEDPSQIGVHSSPQVERMSFPTMVHSQSTSVSISTSSEFSSKDASEKSILPVFSLPSSAGLKKGQDVVWNGLLSEDTLGKIKEAKQQAEDASAFASKAVQHGQELWSHLDRQNNSGLESDVQAKISSAAIAIAAAAAVANAAAAAAKVASNAALQAKLMADEALASMGYENSGHSHDFAACSVENSVGKGDSASKLRSKGGTNSSSIILAAKEAARKRVEATTAASKQAENMDAIVKAAELAAEAVSQAGKIVAMGEPLPLSELIKVGPDGCLKVPQLSKPQQSNELVIRSDETQLKVVSFRDYTNLSAKPSKEGPCVTNESRATMGERSPIQGVISTNLIEDQRKLVDCMADPGILSENDLQGKGRKVSDLAKTIGVVPESEFEASSTRSTFEKVTSVKDNSIKEGSFVEILKDGKAAWFTASVLTLKDGKAYVCYDELRQEKGSEPLKEWVPLESQEDQGPKIRISRPISAQPYEGTRKRRRAVLTAHAWSVGDRVDAWVQDSWREGVVTENQKDGTTIMVHLPAEGETIAVKIWHLRPSVIWKDGKWVEWSIDHGSENSLESDMPREKRPKLGSSLVKAKEDNFPKLSNVVGPGIEDSRLLVLSANERAFNVGKTTQNENKSYPLRTVRTGLQEGSRVIFGVPKPGKKRKFMEVSKHYVANHNKGTGSSDSADFVKYLMPQGPGLRRSKNPTKPEIMGKRASEMKPKGNNKSGKPPGVLGRTLPQRANYLTNAESSSTDGADSATNAENNVGQHNATKIGSSDGPSEEGSMIFSSIDPLGEAPTRERANEGKFAAAGGRKLAKIEEDKVFYSNPIKPTSDNEPRRSVRRIQPTSRLLEGLQSSLTIPKNPSTAHEKGRKRPMRPASKANNI